MASPTRSSSHTPLGVLLGVVGVVALPAGIAYSRYSTSFSLIDAAWLIPVAAIASVAALLVVRGTRGHVRFASAPSGSVRVARILAVIGVCLTLSAIIAVAFYELLLHLEK